MRTILILLVFYIIGAPWDIASGNEPKTAPAVDKVSNEEMEVIKVMDILELLDLMDNLDLLKEMDVLTEDEMYESEE